LFLGGDHITDFVQAEDGDPGVIVDQGVGVFGSSQSSGELEEGKEKGLTAFGEGIVTERRGDMGFPHPGRSNEDEVARAVQSLGVHILEDLVPGDLGIELPVEVTEELDPFDSRGGHQVLDAPLLPFEGFLVKKAVQELLLL